MMFAESNVTLNDSNATTGIMELSPQGGTPFARWFGCCFPKNSGPETKERSSPDLSEVPFHGAKGLTAVTEETQSGIMREYSDANIPILQRDDGSSELDLDMDGQPEFEQPSSSSNKNVQVSNSVVNEFWKIIISIFFLSWMTKSNQQKKLENGGKSTSGGSVASSSDRDSVPIMSFSPEK